MKTIWILLLLASSSAWAQFPGMCEAPIAGRHVLLLGDSHTSGTSSFGTRLVRDLSPLLPAGLALRRFAVSGSAANHWIIGENLHLLGIDSYCDGIGFTPGELPDNFPAAPELLANPNLAAVVIALGTNDVYLRCQVVEKVQMARVQKLLNLIPEDVPCVWIGPPPQVESALIKHCVDQDLEKGRAVFNTFVDRLATTVAPRCHFIDSRKFSFIAASATSADAIQSAADCARAGGWTLVPNTADKTHFSGASAQTWGRCAALRTGQELLSLLK